MPPTRIGVLGAAGRMGRRLIANTVEAGHALGAAVERSGSPELGQDAGTLAGIGPLDVALASDLAAAAKACDAFIDFTAPAAIAANARAARDAGIALVVGTTGLDGAPMEALREAATKIPVVQAANFSIGVNVLLQVVKDLAARMDNYDLEIVELHHRKKVDAPSGTALRLAEAAAEGRRVKLADVEVTGRKGQVGARTDAEIGVLAVRGGDIVGDHTVYFLGPGERIEVTHRAHSRDTFAAGAVRAAAWAVGQKPGLYDMRDVLGLPR